MSTPGLLALSSNTENTTPLPSSNLQQHDANTILVVKFDYEAKEPNELDIRKNERLVLIDSSKKWWLVRRLDSDQTGYVPSNYVKKEKKSIFHKIIPRKLLNSTAETKNKIIATQAPTIKVASFSRAIVKHRYVATRPDELSLAVGTKVYVLEKFLDGWWQVAYIDETTQQQLIGLFPSNHLQEDSLNTSFNSPRAHPPPPPTDINTSLSPRQHQVSPMTNNKSHPSVSSNDRDVEYYRVIYSFRSGDEDRDDHDNEDRTLSVERNEIVRLVEDDLDGLDYDKSWIKVFNSQGMTGMIPASCVEPLLEHQIDSFVFVRRPVTHRGLFANEPWYFGNISRFDSIVLLNRYAQNGEFIVRDSDSGNYSISLKSDNSNNKHFKVFHKDDKFLIGKKVFERMSDLLAHYHHSPIFDQNGEKLYLVRPFQPPSFDSFFDNNQHDHLSSSS